MVVDVEERRTARRSGAVPPEPASGRRGHGRWARAALLAGALASLAGCGAVRAVPAANVSAAPPPSGLPASCSAAALATLTSVLERVYHEGVLSERTASAEYLITHSAALRAAVRGDDAPAARAAAQALLKTGHMTNVTVIHAGHPLVVLGGPALAPLRGTLTGTHGAPIASYLTSVWATEGFLTEARGITQGLVALRAHGRSIDGSPALVAGAMPDEGALTRAGVTYEYTSFPVLAFPSGTERAYLLMPTHTLAGLCGATGQDTQVDTLEHVAELIYDAEVGATAQQQVERVQHSTALLEAVADRDAAATRRAIDALLNQHIVRLRVTVDGRLLEDVGGPYVLAPVSAPLRLHGRTIGELTLSVQDDEGYLRLAKRLAGLDVLMYTGPEHRLVKDSLGAAPGPSLAAVPATGSYRYEGRYYRVFTLDVEAFPSGPLVIRGFIPLPYR